MIDGGAAASMEQALLPEVLVTKVFFEDVDDLFDLTELFNKFLMVRSALKGISGDDEVSHNIEDPAVSI